MHRFFKKKSGRKKFDPSAELVGNDHKGMIEFEWNKVQDWILMYGEEEERVDPTFMDKIRGIDHLTRNWFLLKDIELRLIKRSRNHRYLFDKILKLGCPDDKNLFDDPEYYCLKYFLPGAPQPVKVNLNNTDQIINAFYTFARYKRRCPYFLTIRILPRKRKAPLYDPIPPKKYKNLSLLSRQNLVGVVVDDYMTKPEQDVSTITQLLSMEPRTLQKEVYLLLPWADKEDHQYLTVDPPPPNPTMEELYYKEKISFEEYEDAKLPEKKKQKDRDKAGYPPPLPDYKCIKCHQSGAAINCPMNKCKKRICHVCFKKYFVDSVSKPNFLLLHHAFCQKNGFPRQSLLKPINKVMGMPQLPYLEEWKK